MTIIRLAKTMYDFQQIEVLAAMIWTEHYIPIIGQGQLDYMLKRFQYAMAINEQVGKGAEYYILYHNDSPAGYFSYSKKEMSLFLSKLYVLNTFRGKGIGRKALLFIEGKAKAWDCSAISVTVNKYNVDSIKAYQQMGFKKVDTIVQDIGNGYVMDDYLMEKKLAPLEGLIL
jgi:GNAT superfamily N-acetyltransferase